MALINCKECNSEVSEKAATCPKCGAKLKQPQRSFLGKIIKYTFIAFNILMLWWMIAGVGGAAEHIEHSASEAERAGAAIGTGLGAMFILFIWAIGDMVLGILVLFTRAK